MQNQKVQEYSIEAGPNGLPAARLSKTHNLITFVKSGSEKVHYLDGRWVDDGGNALDEAAIPQDYKDEVTRIPFKPTGFRDATVLVRCEFCGWDGPNTDYPKHLGDAHIRAARASEIAPGIGQAVEPEAAPARLRPEDLPEGNYVTDPEGFVVLNADGSPRKKAGRPRSE